MRYAVTYICTTDYCLLQPTDSECQKTEIVYAPTKTEAIIEFHRRFDFWHESSHHHGAKLGGAHNIWPVVWEITLLKDVADGVY